MTHWFKKKQTRKQLIDRTLEDAGWEVENSQQVGQANAYGTELDNIPTIIAPLDEQLNIVIELDRRFLIY